MIHVGAAPKTPADRAGVSSRIWRIVALVAAFHVLVGLLLFVFFSGIGLAGIGDPSCGGG
jgi:hypothetical protein